MKSLILDLDGTLIDSVPDVCIALNHALAGKGYRSTTPDQIKTMVGGGARVLVEKAIEAVGGNADHVDVVSQDFKDYYSAHPVDQTVIYPGVVETLEKLAADGYKLGICTNKPEATTFPVLDALNLSRFFPVVLCGDTRPYRKPDKCHVLDVIDGLEGNRKDAVFIGDSETDVAAAKNAEIPIILVTYGYLQDPLIKRNADRVIISFGELTSTLCGDNELVLGNA